MKMSAETFAFLEGNINDFVRDFKGIHLAASHYRKSFLTDKRWRWDLFWATADRFNKQTGANLDQSGMNKRFWDHFSGLDDSHIDTALRRIIPSISHYEREAV